MIIKCDFNLYISFIIIKTFEKMTDGEIMRLRYALLNYLQDVHVKVTVFIKEGLQRYNGSFVSTGKWAIPYGKLKILSIAFFLTIINL